MIWDRVCLSGPTKTSNSIYHTAGYAINLHCRAGRDLWTCRWVLCWNREVARQVRPVCASQQILTRRPFISPSLEESPRPVEIPELSLLRELSKGRGVSYLIWLELGQTVYGRDLLRFIKLSYHGEGDLKPRSTSYALNQLTNTRIHLQFKDSVRALRPLSGFVLLFSLSSE